MAFQVLLTAQRAPEQSWRRRPAFVSVPTIPAARLKLGGRTGRDHPAHPGHGPSRPHYGARELLRQRPAQAVENFPATAPAIFQRNSNRIGSLADRNWPGRPPRKPGPETRIAEMYRGRIS